MRTVTKVELSQDEVAKLLASALELNTKGDNQSELRVIPLTDSYPEPDSYHFVLEVENDDSR